MATTVPEQPKMKTMDERITALREKRAKVEEGGGAKRIEKQHAAGQTDGSRAGGETGGPRVVPGDWRLRAAPGDPVWDGGKELPADGVVTGCARIDGRLVHLASQDFTVAGGAAGEVHSDKCVEMMKASLKTGSPFIFINDSGGARIQEGIDALGGYGAVFFNNVMLSGTVPQISLICGPCAGGAVYSPALTDFIIQTKQAQMFITGPSVIKQVTGEVVTGEELGGPVAQMNNSGVVHFVAENDEDAVYICRRLLSFLPSNNLEDPPRLQYEFPMEDDESLNGIVPVEHKQAYDVREISDAHSGSQRLPGSAAGLRAEHRDRLWPHPGTGDRHHRQPAGGAGGSAGHQRQRQGGALHPLSERIQSSDCHVCGRSGLPAGSAAGIRRDHPPRGEDAVCVLGGHGSENHDHSAQGLRRRLFAMCSKGPGRGPGAGLADGRSCGDGRRRRRGNCVPQGD